MSDTPQPEPELDQAFFDTADAEVAAFAQKHHGRRVVAVVVWLAVILSSGIVVGTALFQATHETAKVPASGPAAGGGGPSARLVK